MYNKNGLVAVLSVRHGSGSTYTAAAKLQSSTPLSDVLLRVSVPKWITLSLQPASGNALGPNVPPITQGMLLANTSNGASPTLLRVKVSYCTAAGERVEDVVELSLPATA